MDLLLLAEKQDAGIEVACGDEEPLDGYHVFPQQWRDDVDSLYGVTIPENPAPRLDEHAVDVLISHLENASEKISIVAIGPLTNIAQAFAKRPDIKQKVERIFIMGGAIRAKGNIIVPGFTDHNKNKFAEWNIYIDPVAAKEVFHSGVPMTLVPLDGTNSTKVTEAFAAQFKESVSTPSAAFYDKILDKNDWFVASGEYYFWDPLAAAVAVEPQFCDYENLNVDVVVSYSMETNDEPLPDYSAIRSDGTPRRNLDPYFAGRTIVHENGGLMQVCMGVDDPDAFRDHMIKAINHQYQ